jgi:hypothetical protein
MGIVRKILGPKSKFDKSLPYTYEARIDILSGQSDEPMFESYFSDTVCGLIEYLDENNIKPDEVQLFGCYLGKEIPLEIKHCTTPQGKWLQPPALCKSLEKQYKKTMEEHYKGHVADAECSFEDRDKDGSGPY